MTRYAENTKVAAGKSRDEIERTLERFRAEQFAYGWEANRAMIQFRAENRLVRFVLAMPDRMDPEFHFTPTNKQRDPETARTHWEKACRQRWRALALVVKAKLESVESGIATFEAEFMAQVVLPDGTTVGEWMAPQIEQAYEAGKMPSALPQIGAGEV